ncbi:sulfotransferase [Catalinimonas sp. 4WD22]|uniref:sulfotransferase family protein n=1 Tax=Catalinimonas locisalis TaxID=3133978 RepID=UPI0031018257
MLKVNKSPVFIVSSGRSGTTLLRSFLNGTENIYVPHESDFLVRGFPFYSRKEAYTEDDLWIITHLFIRSSQDEGWGMDCNYIYNYLRENRPSTFAQINNSIYYSYLDQIGKSDIPWGVKAPVLIAHLDRIFSIFPNAKIIHIVRDGRDVCLSYQDIHKKITKRKRFGPNTILANALYWIDGLRRIEKSNNNQVYELRYEDLIMKTDETLKNIFTFLNFSYSPAAASGMKREKSVLEEHRLGIHKNISKPLLKSNILKYKVSMPSWKRFFYELIACPYLQKYSYEIEYEITKNTLFNIIRVPLYIIANKFNSFRYNRRDIKFYQEAKQRAALSSVSRGE